MPVARSPGGHASILSSVFASLKGVDPLLVEAVPFEPLSQPLMRLESENRIAGKADPAQSNAVVDAGQGESRVAAVPVDARKTAAKAAS